MFDPKAQSHGIVVPIPRILRLRIGQRQPEDEMKDDQVIYFPFPGFEITFSTRGGEGGYYDRRCREDSILMSVSILRKMLFIL